VNSDGGTEPVDTGNVIRPILNALNSEEQARTNLQDVPADFAIHSAEGGIISARARTGIPTME
jgi:hypothetical protein